MGNFIVKHYSLIIVDHFWMKFRDDHYSSTIVDSFTIEKIIVDIVNYDRAMIAMNFVLGQKTNQDFFFFGEELG